MIFYYKNIIRLFFIFFIFFNINSSLYASSLDGLNVNLHVGSCNNNGICEAGDEDFFTCPADCTPVVVPPPAGGGGGAVVLVMDSLFNNLTVEVSYNSATIKWNSSIPTITNLKWGTNPDYRDGVIKNINFLLNHKVEITGLASGTVYYFTIEAESLLRKTNILENQVFRTLSLLDTTPPGNPTNVSANSNTSGITISWDNPPDLDFDYVRVMRNLKRYQGSPFIGTLVYEGNGNYFTDSNVKDGVKYFYSLFSRDRAGNYSSGSLIDIAHNPSGKDTWGTTLPPKEEVIPLPLPLKEKYVVTQGSSYYDFTIDTTLNLSGDSPINIKTNYISKTKNDDLWISIRNSDEKLVGQYFFSRARDENGFINVDIPSFEEGGYYSVNIYNYSNDNLKIINKGIFNISKIILVKQNVDYPWFILIILIFLLLLLLLIILIKKIFKRFYRKYSEENTKEN